MNVRILHIILPGPLSGNPIIKPVLSHLPGDNDVQTPILELHLLFTHPHHRTLRSCVVLAPWASTLLLVASWSQDNKLMHGRVQACQHNTGGVPCVMCIPSTSIMLSTWIHEQVSGIHVADLIHETYDDTV